MKFSPFLLERYFAKHEFAVPYQLSCSDCEPLTMKDLMDMASPQSLRLWNCLKFSYTESAGHPLLREAIAGMHEGIGADDILVCVPEEGILLAMNTLLEKGDHVAVISPAYQSLYEIAGAAGCRMSGWQADDSGRFSIEDLKSLVNEKTRMVVVNFPHNPTGSMITAMEMEDLARFCDLMGIILFSDEMYRGLEPEPEDRLPCAAGLSFNSIALSGMSKAFSLPGLRIGWLVCRNPGIRDKLIRLKDYTTICSSAPSEILALIALQNREKIISRNLAIIRKNTGLVEAFVDSSGSRYSWRPPEAGSVAMLDLPGGTSSEEFCRDLLEKKQVLAIGSHLFGLSKPAIRLGLGRESFGEALERGLTDGRRRTAGKARI